LFVCFVCLLDIGINVYGRTIYMLMLFWVVPFSTTYALFPRLEVCNPETKLIENCGKMSAHRVIVYTDRSFFGNKECGHSQRLPTIFRLPPIISGTLNFI